MTAEKILIVEIGGEGGSVRIYARQRKDLLVFWHEGSSWDVDDDVWFGYHSEPVPDLEDALPAWWMNAYPVQIHPVFMPWFQKLYHASLRHDQDMGEDAGCFEQNHWLEILAPKNRKDPAFCSEK